MPSPQPVPGMLRRPMPGRDPAEEHRASTPLELFFDLCFVVAVGQASAQLAEQVIDGHIAQGLGYYAAVFAAIWWAWMHFTWFASAYDNDDVPYRISVFVQVAGALILAAGVPDAFHNDFSIITVGYVVMRIGLLSQWARAARDDPDPARRHVAHRYVIGLGALQLCWIGRLFLPETLQLWAFLLLLAGELLATIIAERGAPSAWHPEHIAERYGLFTLIVLGESVAAATLAVQAGVETGHLMDLSLITLGGLLTVFTMWWMYFSRPTARLITNNRQAFRWGYGHYLILASAAAVGSGLEIATHLLSHPGDISRFAASWIFTAAVAVYLTTTWILHVRPHGHHAGRSWLHPATALLILLTPFTGQPYLATGLLMTTLLVLSLRNDAHHPAQAG
ncbi:low temperature requirement protein A [Streptomyces sp. NPDC093093]|uniref:low temperature requirement protein A n=1 Tax=Streptomyces sp. NPDC093093 TaxID=3366025 RepID=UPI00381DA043